MSVGVRSLPAPEFGRRVVEAAGPLNQIGNAFGGQQFAAGVGAPDAEVFGQRNQPLAAHTGGVFRVMAQADHGHARHGSDHRLTLFQAACLVEVGDAFFGQQMGDVVAVDHDRCQRHAAFLRHFDRIERFDEGRFAALLKRLDHLHHEFFAALQIGSRAVFGLLAHVQPGRGGMTSAARVMAHVRRATETGQTPTGDRRGMPVAIDLQGRTNKQVHGVLAGQLAELPVGTQRAVAPGEEHVRAGGNVVFHAQFGAETVHALDPAAFNGRDQGRVRVERPVAADFAFEPQRLAVGRQDQLDGGGVETDAVVQRLDVVFLVNAANRHHRHQYVHRLDVARVAGEQRLDVERLVGDHHKIDPRGRDIHAWQLADVVHQLIDLNDDDAVAEGGRLDQRGGVFGTRAGVDVARPVGHEACGQHHIGDQVYHQPRIQFDVGVNRTDFQQAIFQQLADAQALRAGKREVQFACDALLEKVQVLGTADAGHDHVQVMHLARIDLGQRAGQKICLFLVIALKHHPVAGNQQGLQRRNDPVGRQHHAIGQRPHLLQTPLFLGATARPACVGGRCCCHDRSTILLSWATLGAIAAGINQAARRIVTAGVTMGNVLIFCRR
ncbi:hypothetical protein ALQ36_05224 [Pseudomonas syringae pv. primulae]|uniref:Uncharacterized protein n=1 Tax=Pseudomonas syringae pv. primulae TaxID=251707 RepID=A0A3M3XWF8_9PSED|nr:hypothetical protein ALQ36_05224 [Pseudomonas syringae pv. primulae]